VILALRCLWGVELLLAHVLFQYIKSESCQDKLSGLKWFIWFSAFV